MRFHASRCNDEAPIYRRILYTGSPRLVRSYAYPGIKKVHKEEERYRGSVKKDGWNRTKGFLVRYVGYTGRESPSSLDYESFGKVLYDGDRANDSRRNERPTDRHPVGENGRRVSRVSAKEFYSRDRIVPPRAASFFSGKS